VMLTPFDVIGIGLQRAHLALNVIRVSERHEFAAELRRYGASAGRHRTRPSSPRP
jgi:hypothetical protein